MDIDWEKWKEMLRLTDESYEPCDSFESPPMSRVQPPGSDRSSSYGFQSSTPTSSPGERKSDLLDRSRLRALLMEEDFFSPKESGTVEEIIQTRAQKCQKKQGSEKESDVCIPCLEEPSVPGYREVPQEPSSSPPPKKKEVLLEEEAFQDLLKVRKANEAKLSNQSMIPRPVPSSQRPPPPPSRIPLPLQPATQVPRARSRSYVTPQEGGGHSTTRIPLPIQPATRIPPLERRRGPAYSPPEAYTAGGRPQQSRIPIPKSGEPQACPVSERQSRTKEPQAAMCRRTGGPCRDRPPERQGGSSMQISSSSRIPIPRSREPQACPESERQSRIKDPQAAMCRRTGVPCRDRLPGRQEGSSMQIPSSSRLPASRKPQTCPASGRQSRTRVTQAVPRTLTGGPCRERPQARPANSSRTSPPSSSGSWRPLASSSPQEDPWDALARELIVKKYGCQPRKNR